MDAKATESSPGMSRHSQRTAVPPQVQEQEHLSGDTEASNLLDRAAVVCQVVRALAHPSEGRDAKIRALQEAVKSGTYQVLAEQIADKMLQDTLHELL
jgi:anti-sigma28 factor (negative regulator of flagellin synthesis)